MVHKKSYLMSIVNQKSDLYARILNLNYILEVSDFKKYI
jgi:hypothetical protein